MGSPRPETDREDGLEGDTLMVDVRKFTPGNGRLTIQLYTKTKIRNYDLQWEKRAGFSIHHEEPIRLSGPSGFDDMFWFARVIMVDQPTGFTAIVALNPHDP